MVPVPLPHTRRPRAPSTLDQLQDGDVGAAAHGASAGVLSTGAGTVSGWQQGRAASKQHCWSLSDVGILCSSCFSTGESREQSSPAVVLVCQEEGARSPGGTPECLHGPVGSGDGSSSSPQLLQHRWWAQKLCLALFWADFCAHKPPHEPHHPHPWSCSAP